MSSVQTRTLADLQRGESARLLPLCLDGDLAHSVMEAGFVPGTIVTMIHSAPWGGPHIYRLDGAEIAIRRELASTLHVEEVPAGEAV